MKQPSGRLMMCVLVTAVVLMGNRSGVVFGQTSNPAPTTNQAQASKQG